MHAPDPSSETAEGGAAPVSKTQRKKAMHELQDLGEALAALKPDERARIDIPQAVRDAIDELGRTRSHEGRRRQLQYIGKLMRSLDPEPIRAGLAVLRGESAAETARLHRLERLRAKLLEDEQTLSEIATAWPGADLTQLRQLRRNALKEQEAGKPPKSFRAIFQILKDLDAHEPE